MIAQQLANGLATGFVYSLLAIGLVMCYSTTKIVNFAHGEVFTLGAFLGLAISRFFHLPFAVNFVLATSIVFGLTSLFAYAVLWKLATALERSVATIAAGLGLRDLILVTFGSDSEAFPPVYPDGAITFGGVRLTYATLIILGATLCILAGIGLLVWRTRWGIWMRAMAQDEELAATSGIPARSVQALAFGAGAALAASAGLLIAPGWQVSYYAGTLIGIKAFTAAIVGGIESPLGALLGGLLVGVLETFLAAYVSSVWKDLGVNLTLLIVLLFLPRGFRGIRAARLG